MHPYFFPRVPTHLNFFQGVEGGWTLCLAPDQDYPGICVVHACCVFLENLEKKNQKTKNAKNIQRIRVFAANSLRIDDISQR